MSLPVTGATNWGIPLNTYITNTVLATATGAQTAINNHSANIPADPHGDRAYASGLVSPITSGVNGPNGFVKLQANGLILTSLLPVGAIKTTFWDAVRDFGAVGNGSTDCTIPLQNALNAAATAGGGEVWVPAGTYIITVTLVIGSNTWLHLSPGAIIRRGTPIVGAAPSIMLSTVNFAATPPATPSASDILISGGQWDATGNGTLSSACQPMYIIGSYFTEITQCGIVGIAGNPMITLDGTSEVTIRDVNFSGPAVGSQSTVPAIRLNSTTTGVTPSGLASGAYTNRTCSVILVQACVLTWSASSTFPPVGRLLGTDLYAGYESTCIVVTGCAVSNSSLLTDPMVDYTNVTYGQAYGNQFRNINSVGLDLTTGGESIFMGSAEATAQAINVDVEGIINYASGNGSSYTRETWHSLTLLNGWTGYARYKKSIDNRVWVDADVDSSAATGNEFAAVPSGYLPTATRFIAAGSTGNVAGGVTANASAYFQCSTTGAWSMLPLHADSSAGAWIVGGSYPLD